MVIGPNHGQAAVFLDRDGVIVAPEMRDGRSFAPRTLEDFKIFPDASAALRRLKEAGYLLVVVTNQPDVGSGLIPEATIEQMHREMRRQLPLDHIEVCYHVQSDACPCRKPKPGMLLKAQQEFDINLERSYMVGDRASDIAAGQAVGCKTIFIDLDYTSEPKPQSANYAVRSIVEAADIILNANAKKRRTPMANAQALNVKIFADGADLKGIVEMYKNPLITGFTTNPTLMRKAGVTDYEDFARKLLEVVPDRPVSFEVFADDFPGMISQGKRIASWGANVNVKVPVMNTKGEFTGPVIKTLSTERVVLNVTAIFTVDQVKAVAEALDPGIPAIVSVFAGRIADTGLDPIPLMMACKEALKSRPKAELLWASPREVLNIFQADTMGCDIITCTNDMIAKLSLAGKDLTEYSRETVRMFYNDAVASAYSVDTRENAA